MYKILENKFQPIGHYAKDLSKRYLILQSRIFKCETSSKYTVIMTCLNVHRTQGGEPPD